MEGQYRVIFGWRRRTKPVLQTESSECALACLVMIANYHGASYEMRLARTTVGMSGRGMNGSSIIEAGIRLNLAVQPYRLEIEELRNVALPAIAHVDLKHCIVVERITGSHIHAVDPAAGRIMISRKEFGKRFTGVLFEVLPDAEFKKTKSKAAFYWGDLAKDTGGLKPAMLQILLLAVLLESLALASPFFMQLIVDKVVNERNAPLLGVVGGAFAVLLLIQTCVSAARTWAMTCLGQQLSYSWVRKVYGHMLRLPNTFFQKRHVGDVISRFDSVTAIQQTMTTRFATVVLDGIMCLITLVLMYNYSKQMTALAVFASSLYAVIRAISFRKLIQTSNSEIAATARQQSALIESVRAVTAIKLFNRQPLQTARYSAKFVDTLNARARIESIHTAFGAVSDATLGLLRVALVLLGAYLAIQGQFTTGMLVAFIAYSDRFAGKFGSLVDFAIEFSMLEMHAERVADIVSEPTENYEKGRPEIFPTDSSVEFKSVWFRYSDKDPWVLRDCTFRVESGSFACITGVSGAGKSTIAKLICGLLEPTAGTVLIGGADIQQLGKWKLRSLLGVVMQDDNLLNGSLTENISFFDSPYDDRKVQACAEMSCMNEEIRLMPMRFETLVGDMGSSLSGGQKQRILLARALYKEPAILLTDEATSHLDHATECELLENVKNMGITRIAVAHRDETVRLSDQIISLRECTTYVVGKSEKELSIA